MENNSFYKHVSSWIDSYYNAEALEWLRNFIASSTQPQEVKDKLNKQVDAKIATLTGVPAFEMYDGITYLVDEHSHPAVFTTRYAANWKLAHLLKHGYKAELDCTGAFYRIRLLGYKTTATDGVELNPARL